MLGEIEITEVREHKVTQLLELDFLYYRSV